MRDSLRSLNPWAIAADAYAQAMRRTAVFRQWFGVTPIVVSGEAIMPIGLADRWRAANNDNEATS